MPISPEQKKYGAVSRFGTKAADRSLLSSVPKRLEKKKPDYSMLSKGGGGKAPVRGNRAMLSKVDFSSPKPPADHSMTSKIPKTTSNVPPPSGRPTPAPLPARKVARQEEKAEHKEEQIAAKAGRTPRTPRTPRVPRRQTRAASRTSRRNERMQMRRESRR